MPSGVYIRTKEIREKMSEALKGRHWNLSEETKKRMSLAHKGKKNSEEHNKNTSKGLKKLYSNIKNHPMYGRHRSEETKRKIGEANKVSQSGKKLSEEHKKSIGKNNARYWKDKNRSEDVKRKISNKLKGRILTEEHKKNIGKASKRMWNKIPKEERRERNKNSAKAGAIASQKANPSSIEKLICKILDRLNIKYKTQISFCHGKFIVDIYVPSKNLVIECNGTYWHNYDKFPKQKIRDNNLQRYCDKWGYKLAWIWEKDIRKNPKLALKNVLENIL